MSDPISRSDAIWAKPEYRNEDMLDKEKSTYNKGWNDCNDAWVAIIKALPSAEPPTGELISKADAIELLTKIVFDEPPYLDSETLCRKYAEEQINTLPSAEYSNAKTQNSNQETQKSNGDLIYRADAIEAVRKMPIRDLDRASNMTLIGKGEAIVELYALPSAEAVQGEWIPCSERLPKKGEVVLITNGKDNVRCGQYRSEYDVRGGVHYWWWKGKTVESVLAWMPLPDPYKGE